MAPDTIAPASSRKGRGGCQEFPSAQCPGEPLRHRAERVQSPAQVWEGPPAPVEGGSGLCSTLPVPFSRWDLCLSYLSPPFPSWVPTLVTLGTTLWRRLLRENLTYGRP